MEDAMQPSNAPLLDADDTIAKAVQEIDRSNSEYLLVRLSPTGWSTVSKEQVLAVSRDSNREAKLAQLLLFKPGALSASRSPAGNGVALCRPVASGAGGKPCGLPEAGRCGFAAGSSGKISGVRRGVVAAGRTPRRTERSAKLDHHLGFAIALENVQLLSVSLRKIPTKALSGRAVSKRLWREISI